MKIAVVDDDRSAFELLKTQISQLLTDRTDIVWFSSGEEFLRCADSRNFDLIILDIFMDRLTGMEVAKEIRKNDGEICIVFCTSSNDFASESYEVGASYYLRKPWDPARLKAMFDRLDLNRLELSRAVRLPDGRKAALCDIISADCSSHFVTLHCKEGGGDPPSRLLFGNYRAFMLPFAVFQPRKRAYNKPWRGDRQKKRHLCHVRRADSPHKPTACKRGAGGLFLV